MTGIETQTAIYYAPQTVFGITLDKNDVLAASDRDASGDTILRTWTKTDGFGRTLESWTRDPQGDVRVATIYDPLGRMKQTSNPYRQSETPVYSTTTYDLAGRVTVRTTPDGAAITTAYDGARVMVTDAAQKKRISESDALGRLLKVWEVKAQDSDTVSLVFPQSGGMTYYGYLTQYAYDVLNDLTTVTQGVQTRTFAYDSLKRLLSATNPESGATSYLYDSNSNLLEKTDARTAKTTLTYDALNRVKSKTYSGTTSEGINAANATAPVYYKYDNQAFPSGAPAGFNRGLAVGRLAAVTYGSGTASAGSYFGYDELGRALRKTQQINGNNYAVQGGYNRASGMTSETYPSGRTVSYAYDTAGRLSTFSGTLGDGLSRTYASVTQYSAAGLKERESYGTGTNGMTTPLYLKLHYNKRQQLVDLRLGSVNDEWNWNRGALTFYYGSNAVSYWNPFWDDTDNNGNVRRVLNYVPTVLAGDGSITSYVIPELQDYTSDELNRIGSVTEAQMNASGGWTFNVDTQTFGYDRYGNRKITAATGGVNNYNPSYNTSNNRISGLTYDSVGNITTDGLTGGTMTYDAENRLLTATNGGGGSYTYDGEGKRVKRQIAGQEWWYVYGISGELLAEYLSTAPTTVKKEYGYRGGQLLLVWDSALTGDQAWKWLVTDHLGSTRMEADKSGSLIGMKRHDYLPFGEELTASVGAQRGGVGYEPPASNVRERFGSKERDTETGLDYFGARYYASAQGRFISPDWSATPVPVPYADFDDPQTLNLYAYVRNNPVWRMDVDGHRWWDKLRNWATNGGWTDNDTQAQKTRYERRVKVARFYANEYAKECKCHFDSSKYSDEQIVSAFNNGVFSKTANDRLDPLQLLGIITVFRGGPLLQVKPSEVKIDKNTGLVNPERGVSVNLDPVEVQKFGGAYKIESVPPELEVVQRGTNPNHYEIIPRQAMTFERYQQLLNQVKLTRVP